MPQNAQGTWCHGACTDDRSTIEINNLIPQRYIFRALGIFLAWRYIFDRRNPLILCVLLPCVVMDGPH